MAQEDFTADSIKDPLTELPSLSTSAAHPSTQFSFVMDVSSCLLFSPNSSCCVSAACDSALVAPVCSSSACEVSSAFCNSSSSVSSIFSSSASRSCSSPEHQFSSALWNSSSVSWSSASGSSKSFTNSCCIASTCSSSSSSGVFNTNKVNISLSDKDKIDDKTNKSSVTWNAETEAAFLRACKDVLNYAARRDLERRVRSGTGTEEKGRLVCCQNKKGEHNHKHTADSSTMTNCCDNKDNEGEEHSVYIFKKDENDYLGYLLDEFMKENKLREILADVAEKSADIYHRVISKGKADGMQLESEEEEKRIRYEILKESVIRQIQLKISRQIIDEKYMDSHEGGLLAIPAGYLDGPLNFLTTETIRDLMFDGVAVQNNFLGEELRAKIYEEIELMEYDSKFNEMTNQQYADIRTDHMVWVTLSDLDREKQRGLFHLFKVMLAFPFELNMKAKLGLQVSNVFQLSYYNNNGAYYSKHMDGGYDKNNDNGRKITSIYYPNPSPRQKSDGGILRVYKRQSFKQQQKLKEKNEKISVLNTDKLQIDIIPNGDTLVLFRSRDMPHEITSNYRKRFAISLWLNGPPGPGDDL